MQSLCLLVLVLSTVSAIDSGRSKSAKHRASIPVTIDGPDSIEYEESAFYQCQFNMHNGDINIDGAALDITESDDIQVQWFHNSQSIERY